MAPKAAAPKKKKLCFKRAGQVRRTARSRLQVPGAPGFLPPPACFSCVGAKRTFSGSIVADAKRADDRNTHQVRIPIMSSLLLLLDMFMICSRLLLRVVTTSRQLLRRGGKFRQFQGSKY